MRSGAEDQKVMPNQVGNILLMYH